MLKDYKEIRLMSAEDLEIGDMDYIPPTPNKLKVDGGGERKNDGKIRLSLLPASLFYAAAKVMMFGAKKYADHNWRRGMKWSVPFDCAMRHLLKWWDGEQLDEESGESHLGHAVANLLMLIEYEKTCPELDDRFKGPLRDYKDF